MSLNALDRTLELELETLKAPIYLSRSSEQFIEYLRQALEDKTGVDERVAFAAQADWGRRLEVFLNALEVGL